MGKELIDLVDKNDKIIGVTDVEAAHRLKQFHRVVGIFVFDDSKCVYLQKENKYNRYDCSVGGHVRTGESPDEAACRELLEELALEIPLTKISTFLAQNSQLNHIWSLYEGKAPTGWQFKKTREVKAIEKLRLDDLVDLISTRPEKFTQGLINTLREYIRVKGLTVHLF